MTTAAPRRGLAGDLPAFARDPLGFLTEAGARGPLVPLRFGRTRGLLVNDPALIEQVLVTQRGSFVKSRSTRVLWRLIGNGLLLNEGESWLQQRRLAQPAFHRDRLAAFAHVISSSTAEMADGWRDGESRDVEAEVRRLTTDVTARLLFGADVHVDTVGAIDRAVQTALTRYASRRGAMRLVPSWAPIPAERRYRAAVAALDARMQEIVRARRAAPAGTDLLGMLLAARDEHGAAMDDRQVRDEAVTLFVAGFDAPAVALGWAWHLLAEHPAAQARLSAEVDAALGGRLAGVADVPRLPFTEMVIKETLRLYPPAWLLGREARADVSLGGTSVRAGTAVLIAPWVLHREASRFPDPTAFRPERWADGSTSDVGRFGYFPFGGGPRICIGASLAMLECILALATLAQRVRFTSDPARPVTPWPTVTLRVDDGIHVPVARR